MQGFLNIQKSINMIQHINKMKEENPHDLSITQKKAFDKFHYSCIIKSLNKINTEETMSTQ